MKRKGFWLMALVLCVCFPVIGSLAQSPPLGQSAAESAQHGFPEMMNLHGDKLADGEFIQWTENGILHVKITYHFADGRTIEEKTSLRQTPQLVQQAWSWTESKNGGLLRHFEVDFKAGKAVAEKRERGKVKRWSEAVKIELGRTFAGFGFVLAIEQERERLVKGEKIQLRAVGFIPKPKVVPAEIFYHGLDQMSMAGRIVQGDRFTIHPEVSALARVFVAAKDTQIWLTTPPAASFLRWEGPLVEAQDPIIRVDRIPGEHSGTAEPASKLSTP
ncbi:MAG TPA: hypothetical protein VFB72_12945 [Verrucomicrobiae bacterium]|nr:hypothetical protein [Verrucomicrobiae bacterium]